MKKLYLITLIFNVCILSAAAQTSAKQNAQQPADSIKNNNVQCRHDDDKKCSSWQERFYAA